MGRSQEDYQHTPPDYDSRFRSLTKGKKTVHLENKNPEASSAAIADEEHAARKTSVASFTMTK